MLGQGMKVVIEIAVMAADAGLVRVDEDVIVIAGSAGAQTTPLYSNRSIPIILRPESKRDTLQTEVLRRALS